MFSQRDSAYGSEAEDKPFSRRNALIQKDPSAVFTADKSTSDHK